MDNNEFKTSFIPKQAAVETPAVARSGVSLISTLAFVILLLSILLAAGAYGYEKLLFNEINRPCPDPNQIETSGCGLEASLNKERQALDEGLLTEFKRLATKLNLAARLIEQHVTILPLMDLLSEITLENVRYTSFEQNNTTLTISGLARSYDDIAVQSNVFDEEQMIKSFLFSDLNLDGQGNVVFKLVMNVDPRLLSYTLAP